MTQPDMKKASTPQKLAIVFGGALSVAVLMSACVTEPPDVECLSDTRYFQERVWNSFMSVDCFSCHNAQGVAAGRTEFILKSQNEPGFLQKNFDIVKATAAFEVDGTSIILRKPTLDGLAHEGGLRFEVGSENYTAIEGLLERFENPAECQEEQIDFFGRVELADNEATLRKAAITLVGRLPTAEERAQVAGGDSLDLDAVLDGMLEEEAFYDRLTEMYNDHFLTDRYLGGNNAVGLLDQDIFPDARWHDELDDIGGFTDEFIELAQRNTNNSVARAPLQLINYVVRNDLPFTEILTADYMMVNGYSAKVYGIDDVEFTNPSNPAEFRPGRIPGVPHAGVLSDPMFLNRFPTTDTNRNRHRSRMTQFFFLATDILQLADRPVASGDIIGTNPTLNNPNCNVCHNNIDPIAGAFQNWDDEGRYAPGDIWHPEMLPPGYKAEVMTPEDWPNSLQWLAERITTDDLFALSAVQTAYQGLTGQKQLKQPGDLSAPDFEAKQAAFNAQNAEFEQLAAQFRDSGFNYKVLIKSVVKSGWFRAVNAEADIAEYADVGTARFLTPELLDRKIEAVTTRAWDGNGRRFLRSSNEFLIFYGGIDSDGVTQRITNPNGLMSAVAARMSNEMACETTALDFARAPEDRVYFPVVEPTFEPEDANGFEIAGSAQAIRENIQHLHQHILGERLELDDPEIDRTYQLFLETYREGRTLRANDEIGRDLNFRCQVRTDPETGEDLPDEERIFNDDNYTIRSWMAVVTYMLGDYRFLHE